ncbi:hypothetical protein LXA47_15960 [Massilia sp. P8910]|uniref:hypothetical protein n=1 Tax=Massilia antarctica TaxID=2765360 RepID=UPI001E63A63A|nr:hypothetical protein [Massilia antarctica]MCE3605097.1 hypothetical protein [Massilia antarctica]
MKRNAFAFLLGLAAGALIITIALFFWNRQKMTKVHVLEAPLLLQSNEMNDYLHLLPKGTTLYYDTSFPEGFSRYKVYINIDRMPLALKELTDPTMVDPLTAHALDAGDLRRVLRDYPLSKRDLESILKSKALSRDDIKEVFNSYLESTK